MGLLAVCLVSSFMPQGPVATAPASPPAPTHPAAWLPATSSVAVVVTADGAPKFDAAALQRLRGLDPSGSLRLVLDQVQNGLAANGLSHEDVIDLLQGGLGVALHGSTAQGRPAITFVARSPSRSDAFRAALQSKGQARRIDSVDCYELGTADASILGGVFGQHVVLTTDAGNLLRTVAATRVDDPLSLEHAAAYATSLEECAGGAPAAQLFVRPAQLLEHVAEPQAKEQLTRAFEAFAIDRIDAALLGWTRDGGRFRVSGSMQGALTGPLAALAGAAARLDERLAGIVPDDASAFALMTTDLGLLVKQTLDAVARIEPAAADAARQAIAAWQGAGTDGNALLDGTDGRIAIVQMPAGGAIAVAVKDPKAYAPLLGQALGMAGLETTEQQLGESTVRTIEDPFGATTYCGAIGDWLVFAQGREVFEALQRQVAAGRVAPGVAAALATAPAQTTYLAVDRADQVAFAVSLTEGRVRLETLDAATQDPSTTTAGAGVVRALHEAEAAGAAARLEDLEQLADDGDPVVAQRATWLIGKHGDKGRLPLLQRLARQSPDAGVRLQAMHALSTAANVSSLQTAADALEDGDLRVRAAAAQLLGKLRKPAGKEPLLAFLQRYRRELPTAQDTSDVQAALVALHDLGAKDELLPATTTLDEATQNGVGQALAFYWQGVSPQFAADQETTLLLAALDHSSLLLRRYAIDRLAELNSKIAVPALEKRLAHEGPELRPLVEATLSYLRRDQDQPKGDELDRALANAEALWGKALTGWNKLDEQQQVLYAGGGGGLLFVIAVGAFLVQRRRKAAQRAEEAAAAAAMAAPSEDYEGEYYEEYAEGDAQYAEGAEYEEQVYEDAGSYR